MRRRSSIGLPLTRLACPPRPRSVEVAEQNDQFAVEVEEVRLAAERDACVGAEQEFGGAGQRQDEGRRTVGAAGTQVEHGGAVALARPELDVAVAGGGVQTLFQEASGEGPRDP